MINKKLIIGLGTGRCGTMSLSNLLNSQPNIFCSHELISTRGIFDNKHKLLPWIPNYTLAKQHLDLLFNKKTNIVADVSFFWLNYVEWLIDTYKDTKFICLKRNKTETINSFLIKTINKNHWQFYAKHKSNIWDKSFPTYNTFITKDAAISKYYDEYYTKIYTLQKKYFNNIKIFNTEDLNDSIQIKNMLNFININTLNQYNIIKIHKNKTYNEY